jgi:cysteine desulfurase
MLPFLTEQSRMGNPSSLYYEGRRAGEVLEQCHDKLAGLLGSKSGDVVFNSGGSEGNTHALLGTALFFGRRISVAVSAIEHKAILNAAERLRELGHKVSVLPVTRDGVVDLDGLSELLSQGGCDLVSVMAVNNETGAVQPIGEISTLCKAHAVLLHCDAVQAVGHGFLEMLKLPDLVTFSAHKFGGPRGAGAMIQRGLRLPALICGGTQEHGCRAGTENLAGVVGLLKALEGCTQEESDRLEGQRLYLESELARIASTEVHAVRAKRAPHISSIAFPGHLGRHVQQDLDRSGFAVGLGSACSGCDNRVSHVLGAMQISPSLADATVRFSLGWNSKYEDTDRLLMALKQLL